MPYLPQGSRYRSLSAPGYDAATGNNTGDLGFMRLPVERTIGGFENNIWNPRAVQFPGGSPPPELEEVGFNPYTQGSMTGEGWRPYLPDKIVLGQRLSNSRMIGDPTQISGGQRYGVGVSTAPRREFSVSAPTLGERQESLPASTSMISGDRSYSGYFDPGTFEPGRRDPRFWLNQPNLNMPQRSGLGTFQPWNPALNALEQSRRQP